MRAFHGSRRLPDRGRRLLVTALAVAIGMALFPTAMAAADTADTAEITPAPSHLPQSPTVDITPRVIDLTFPVADPGNGLHYPETFLALRGGGSRLHAATDIMAPKHRPIHAAVGGHITFAPYPEARYGWMLSILGDDGYRYAYVHLNNDTPEKNDSGAWLDDDNGGVEHAYAPRIVEAIRTDGTARGLRIERGELIGWAGDSGNAKNTASHLHFETHVPANDDHDGYRVNPYHSLVAAMDRGDVPGAGKVEKAFDGRFGDVDPDGTHAEAIERLADDGIISSCEQDRYCPGDAVTRADLAVSVAAVSGLATTATTAPRFPDVNDEDPRAGAIAAVDAAGILNGYEDGTIGPEDPLTRAQHATMLVRTFAIPAAEDDPPFTDVTPGRTHVDAIAATYEAGLTIGCEDGTRYCGRDDVTRAQIASFLDRARAAFATD
jgi:murein DD-endopeptidase MepM/ murein hydrolase activator NlpD